MKKKGISLIILVITVIVIIILATTIIVNIANTNVIDNSHAAVFKSDVAAMQDELTMYIADEYTDALGKYDSKKLQATDEGIWYGSTQQEGIITDIIKSMDEKYVGKLFIQDGKLVANKMAITVEEEKWLEDIGITSTTQTDIGSLIITPSTKDWINGNVELEIGYTKEIPEGYAIEYKINNGSWQEGTRVVVDENNTKVTTRLYSKEKNNEALSNSYTVSKIDKEVPDITNMKIDITAGTNSITATASGATDSLSGLAKYQYSIDGTVWQDSGVFTGYKNATEVTVYAKAIDKVGNESSSVSNNGTTTAISGTVTITQTPAAGTWTKGNVTVTLSYANIPTGYVMQYKLGSGNWTAYSSAITVTTNNTTVTARLYNASVDDEVASNSRTISNIDKGTPSSATIALSSTSTNTISSITAVVKQEDSLSGLDITNCKWVYNTTSTNLGTDVSKYTGGSFASDNHTLTLTKTTGGTYYLHVLTKDNAGNYIETISSPVTVAQCVTGISISGTKSVIISSQSQLTANVSPSTASNKAVTWASSDTSIATVSNTGLVTTYNSGTTTITATAVDGSGVVGSTTFTVNKDSSVKILIMHDLAITNNSDYTLYHSLAKYFSNVTFDNSLTKEQLLASNYDLYVNNGNWWSAYYPEEVNALFAAGKNIYTTGNDTNESLGFGIIKNSYYAPGTYTATKVINNSISQYMRDNISESDQSMNLLKFVDGTEKWYTTTIDGETYDIIGCLTGSKGNRWCHSQFWGFVYNANCDLQQLVYYLIGK